MLDVRMIREKPDYVKERLLTRQKSYNDEIDEILALDRKRRDIIFECESLKAEQNAANKEIPAIKKSGGDAAPIFAKLKAIAERVKAMEADQKEIEAGLNEIIMGLPNLPNERVHEGKDSEDNREVRRNGQPREFAFEPKPHWELGEALGILDPQTAAKVTGARFHFYKGCGAKLERAVMNYFLDSHAKRGYTEIFPPFMANRASMTATGQLPKFEEDAFRLANEDYFLIPTAEVPVTNMHRDDILPNESLPLKYCAYSACFRAEAGSAGRDTRGLIRQHQFNKVELVKFSNPESSFDELEALTSDAEAVLAGLGLPYRVVLLCSGDMGFSSAMTYDIEVFLPSYNRYVEISSCSNFEDFQARRGNMRFRGEDGKPAFVHTLNGSGVAIGRTVAAILENFQNEDGSVTIPEALKPYFGGVERITGI